MDALQDDLEQVREELLCPESVNKHLEELRRGIATGQEELRYYRFLLDIIIIISGLWLQMCPSDGDMSLLSFPVAALKTLGNQ